MRQLVLASNLRPLHQAHTLYPRCLSHYPRVTPGTCVREPHEYEPWHHVNSQIFADDPNAVSVITYALLELRVEYIVVAGHSRCGGVAVCIDQHLTERDIVECFKTTQSTSWPPPAPIDQWLQPLRDLAESYPHPPTVLELVKANVQEQVKKMVELPVVQGAWASVPGGKALKGVHGWWYELETGLVHDLNIGVYGPE